MRQLILLTILAPLAWFLFRFVRSRFGAQHLYAIVLYCTFLGDWARIGQVSLAATAVVALVSGDLLWTAIRRRPIDFRPGVIDLSLGCIVAWILLVSAWRSETTGLLRGIGVALAVVSAAKLRLDFREPELRAVLAGPTLGGIMLAVLCIVQTKLDASLFGLVDPLFYERLDRTVGLFRNPNGTAFYLVISAAILMSRLFPAANLRPRPSLWSAARHLPLVWLLTWAVVLTQSRAAFGALFVAGAVALLTMRTWPAWSYLLVAVVAAWILGSTGNWPSLVQDSELFASREGLEESGREIHWRIGIETVAANPIFGDAEQVFRHAAVFYHNDLLQIAANYGILPAALFVFAIGGAVVILWRFARLDRGEYARSVLIVVCGAVTMSWFHGLLMSGICFWFLVGLAAANRSRTRLRAGQRARFPSAGRGSCNVEGAGVAVSGSRPE